MTISSKRLPKQGVGVAIKSPLQAKRTASVITTLLEPAMTHRDLLDEAMNLLDPLSLDDSSDSTAIIGLDEGTDLLPKLLPASIQPSDQRRRMLRRGSKCPHMFFREIDSYRSWRSIPVSLSLSSRILQSTYCAEDSEQRVCNAGTSKLRELSNTPEAQPSFLQATQEGARAA
jgi:hypothetical protein